MSMVGNFPGFRELNRRTIRAQVNPLDKSTIVSIYPKELDEKKVTLQPGRFIVPPGTYDNPAVLIVGPSSWWREIDEEQPLLEIPQSSILIADSVIKDYCNGILACNMFDRMPGLFFIPGELKIEDIKKTYKGELDKAMVRQRNWYTELLKMADALWARSNGNPLAIDDFMRLAAKEMNQLTRDWMKDFQMVDMSRCPACGGLRNPLFPVCPNCHAIVDPEKAKALNIQFAQRN